MKKILIIEDNSMMRMFLSNYLGKNYLVKAVESPSEAIELLSESDAHFDLVITDYIEEDAEEMQAIEALNLQLKWKSVPLFMLTDEDKSEQRITAFSLGANEALSKPFNPKELNLRISLMLHQHHEFKGLRTVA